MSNIRRGENKRESWWATNNSSKTVTMGDLLLVPAIKPGKRIDLLNYYSREKISHSTVLVSLVKSGIISLNKNKIYSNEFPGAISSTNIDEAITPSEENEIFKESETNETYLKLDGSNADQDIGINNYELKEVGGIGFDTNPTTPDHGEGSLHWNQDAGTLDLDMEGEVRLQIGQEILYHVTNKTGSLIPNGTAVRYAGGIGNSGKLLVTPMLGDGTYNSELFLGVTTDDIPNEDNGWVTHFGKVRGIDTRGSHGEVWNDGDVLYLSPIYAGELTNIEPNTPNNDIKVAIVNNASTNGVIEVKTTFNPKLTCLQDVDGDPLTTNGQILVWDNDNNYFDFDYNINTSRKSISTKTNDYIIITTDYTILADCSSNSVTITLPSDPSSSIEGYIYNIKCINDTYTCTVSANGNNIDGDTNDITLIKNESITVQADIDGNWWII